METVTFTLAELRAIVDRQPYAQAQLVPHVAGQAVEHAPADWFGAFDKLAAALQHAETQR